MPRPIIDCRGCIYYRYPEELDDDLREWCLKWIEEHRPGERLQGYCSLYRRPVTYLRGYCSGYRSSATASPAKKPITYYLSSKRRVIHGSSI